MRQAESNALLWAAFNPVASLAQKDAFAIAGM
jgi:hypothetical protein